MATSTQQTIMKPKILSSIFLLILTFESTIAIREPLVSPYVDVTRMTKDYLLDLNKKAGLKSVTLAFVLGSGSGCEPTWGGEFALENEYIITNIKDFQNIGGSVILATGGAMGPYLENSCSTSVQLAKAYKKALDVIGTSHLDIDIEASLNIDLMINALKQLRSEVPDLTISFTMMVQGDDYGLTDSLGVDVLKRVTSKGLQVNTVNAMTMEFFTKLPSWGKAVINAGEAVHGQMKTIWPKKSDAELYAMLGITPMIGRNFNGKIFEQQHAEQLVQWAKERKVGHLSFWSIGRDNGDCPGGGISPDCSSISQEELEFSKIFQKYAHTHIPDHFTTEKPTTKKSTTSKPITKSLTSTTTLKPTSIKPGPKPDCSKGDQFLPHEIYCNKYYWCFEGRPHLEQCPSNTVWDPKISTCNFARDADRHDCI